MTTPHDELEQFLAGLRAGPNPLAPKEETPEPAPVRYLDGWSFITQSGAAVEPLWGRDEHVLWAQGESIIIVGGQGAGKSTIAQQLVLHAIGLRDGDLLGLPVAPAQRVLYLAMDRPRQIARSFRRMVTADDEATVADRLVVWPGPPPVDLARDTELLTRMAHQADASVLVIDSLKDAAVKLSDDEVGGAVNRAVQRALQAGIEVVVLHHHRKQGNGMAPGIKTLDDIYGSTWITSGAGSVVGLTGQPGGAYVDLAHIKQPALEVGPLVLYHDHDLGVTTIEEGFDMFKYLRGQPRPVTVGDAARAMTGEYDVGRNDRQKARRLLDKMVERGVAVKVSDGTKGGGPDRDEARYSLAAQGADG
jgi:replicative DNA helicase